MKRNSEIVEQVGGICKMATNEPKKYIAHWNYYDGSGSGILPIILNISEVELLKLAIKKFGTDKNIEFQECE